MASQGHYELIDLFVHCRSRSTHFGIDSRLWGGYSGGYCCLYRGSLPTAFSPKMLWLPAAEGGGTSGYLPGMNSGPNKMDIILQTTFSIGFSSKADFVLWRKYHWMCSHGYERKQKSIIVHEMAWSRTGCKPIIEHMLSKFYGTIGMQPSSNCSDSRFRKIWW